MLDHFGARAFDIAEHRVMPHAGTVSAIDALGHVR